MTDSSEKIVSASESANADAEAKVLRAADTDDGERHKNAVAAADSGSDAAESESKPDKMSAFGVVKEITELVVVTLLILIVIRGLLVEPRYIPSGSMEPTLQAEDRILVEKISKNLGKEAKRGDILVFYPPASQLPGGKDLSNDPATVLGRLTGLPFLPYEPAFIKRVVGLPGEKIKIKRGVGVFIDEKFLNETSYIKDPPAYDLIKLGDIGHATIGDDKRPYKDRADEPIIVPPGMVFMLGDNRNNSEDSHVWGFLDEKRVIGRACLLFWRKLDPPQYSDIINRQRPEVQSPAGQ
ncbi:MAG: signal peptidase I [Candidatus Obscuribacterales bacterium]